MSHRKSLRDYPFSVQWRAALVRLPRLTPLAALRSLSRGPYPVKLHLPSRGQHKISVYCFLPPDVEHQEDKGVPVHLDFHGGSFISGSCEEQGPFCSKLARERGILVLEIDYCKGPYYEFPAALEDAEDVLAAIQDTESKTEAGRHLRHHLENQHLSSLKTTNPKSKLQNRRTLTIDPSRISISGFSSGGNLALNLVLNVKTEDVDWPCRFPATHQNPIPVLLFYPSFDLRVLPHERERPKKMPGPGRLARSIDTVLWPTYIPEHARAHPRASPGLVDTRMIHKNAHLFLVLPEFDTLAIQSKAWVEKLHDEGQESKITIFNAPGMSHGFCNFPDKWLSGRGLDEKEGCFARMTSFWNATLKDAQDVEKALNAERGPNR